MGRPRKDLRQTEEQLREQENIENELLESAAQDEASGSFETEAGAEQAWGDGNAIDPSVYNTPQEIQRGKIRNLISSFYDIQKLRISTGNRLVQSFNINMGQKPSTRQEDMDKEAQKAIQILRKEYERITDAYIEGSYVIRKKVNGHEETVTINVGANKNLEKIINRLNEDRDAEVVNIRSKMDYNLIKVYMDLLANEENVKKLLKVEVEKHPLWDLFFRDVAGCGPTMSAMCIAYFDIHKARHTSSFWKYAGLDTVAVTKEVNGEEVVVYEGRAKKHTEMREYTNKDGELATKVSITYNAVLKSRLMGVLAGCFLKKRGSYYGSIYYDYRNRLVNRTDTREYTAKHIHMMACRYMIKQFLRDLWYTWREYEGYEVSEPYEVAYLGRMPHMYNEAHHKAAERTQGRYRGNGIPAHGGDRG